MSHLGFDDREQDETSDKFSRIQMIDFVCRMKSEECLSRMHSKLKSHIDNKEKSSVNLDPSVFCYGLMASALLGEGPELMDALVDKMETSDSTEYRLRIIRSLGCFGDVIALRNLLEKFLLPFSEDRYLSDETIQVVHSVISGSAEGVEASIDFMKEYSSETVSWSQTSNLIEVLIENLSKGIFNERLLDKVKFP